jgi:ureidoacrylate peracid hydrolase
MPDSWYPLPDDLVRQATYRRNGLAVFGRVDLARTALLVLNMQNAWLAPGAPFRLGPCEGLLARINAFARRVRQGGGQVAWIRTRVGAPGTPEYWSTYYDNFIEPGKRAIAVAALTPGHPMSELDPAADVREGDWVIDKFRFSPFVRNSVDLERRLRDADIENVIVVGTATNVCCESTLRDAMARDFRTFMPYDLVSAPTEDGHYTGLRSVMQAFADVRDSASLELESGR